MTIISQLTAANFLQQVDNTWPFAQDAQHCLLTQCTFNAEVISPELFTLSQLETPRGSEKRQSEFLAGRICAAHGCKLLHNQWLYPKRNGTDRAPLWDASVTGSISHSKGKAMAVVGDAKIWQSLGLDIEHFMPLERAQRLACEILTTRELTDWHELPESQQAQQLTLIFSAKESLFKALNPLTEAWFGLQDASVKIQQNCFEISLQKDLNQEWHKGQSIVGLYQLTKESVITLVRIKR
ncbi:4'-phosphopantetheinyl transferase superfamily protein [Pseudomonas sp. F1_0610]|uniref:4'-phosphopantetheinyl transferase family protein n=1 Tax=Pseudomonas sp. F1_0610 TaxID=3114284 RepID=UPI0039C26FFD